MKLSKILIKSVAILLIISSCNGHTIVKDIVEDVNTEIQESIASSTPYKESMKIVNHNNYLLEKLGSPIESDLSILELNTISITENNGTGKVNMHIALVGLKGKADLHVVGFKKNDEWRYTTMKVTIKDSNEPVNLLLP